MKYLLGIDFGGGASKATLLDTQGRIAAENTVEYPTLYPQPGFCEQRPEDWCRALCENTRALLEKSGAAAGDILALALDSATHTWVAADENFEPLFPAIHWTDTRARQQAAALREEHAELIFRLTFHQPDTIWSLPQFLWVRQNRPEAFTKIRRIFFEKDYLRFFLTGVFCTDFIDAQGSLLFDATRACWSPELAELVGIDMEALPPLCRPDDTIGQVTPAAAAATGLCAGTPVICGTTDTCMEVFAAGAVHQGDATVKLATAGRICVVTDRPCPDRDLVNYAHIVPGLWYPGSATKSAAASLRWYRDTFGGDYRELDRAAADIPIGSEGLFFHPYLNGELTPYADPALCGSFVGIRATHGKAHFTRSVLEGVAFSLYHCRQKMQQLGLTLPPAATLIGGGSKSALWAQITADCLGMDLQVNQSSDSSLGSAMLAGLAIGVFKSPEEAVRVCIQHKGRFSAVPENTRQYARLFERYVRIHDVLAPVYGESSL